MGQAMVVLLVALLAHVSVAAADKAMVEDVAQYVGVPSSVLYAMALTESGVTRQGERIPWPWTLNIEGEAYRYETRQAMFEGLMAALQAGRTRVDIGPMQVNWFWHYDIAGSPWTITDPVVNLKIGAGILKGHYLDTGDWWSAVGRYHRPAQTPKHQAAAQRYAGRVRKAMAASLAREMDDA